MWNAGAGKIHGERELRRETEWDKNAANVRKRAQRDEGE